ncbi:30S ribosomal protein S5 [Candidatus Uhrbacteria bacterium CG_4_9_14_0_2_um_filter_41_50]|uniref:Small ribosomal subunit protein uS5 n=1 Tax=Candidatus Uhrbacteria bacterium CG_4_9_14_0_2_um_filter_41_50 TaxID=1975031 RepID=A0A2M8EQB5_9BACT|nr:MAG: 30S ribosomal protein S5 [Candidatus Uhrbacteria bacterium CG_4_10_14_3_um_filter_41_21]PIZ55244.1 MAG: 30S ribosomal protein S5 [Candidatus Uhrbacteria bacterium CG_4_10_14_0_2_um_filter_41_21]PJB84382.1 MAG: 30S ribosomal protein S5 [Candidatus Uhrbacteria bacterium CG_4_9_14_0_8_um_filter_41_16]PJC24924.1 MAG: 30S ribosomal protein S5 [Candidatus Uhrbacteria bacterium CG_4_9_14_0_2_um_filter_41_50]PJE74986.1 MAG: 30S ribosomal protein S5 [Candidatus Uhrbacteria bacterium CG10_big_fil
MEDQKAQSNNYKARNKGGIRKPKGKRRKPEREPREFEQKILELARVTRVTKGGKRMRFRACLIIGDRKGRAGMGVAKGADVAMAVEKAFRQAKKNMISIPVIDGTIPHEVRQKYGAAQIILKPAPEGTGLKSGGAIRMVLELGGVPNAVSKILGTNNKINNATATFAALKSLREQDNEMEDKGKKGKVKEGKEKEASEVISDMTPKT